MWLKIACCNNSLHKVASFYVQTVSDQGMCPVELITDLGTENGLAASIQSLFRGNPDPYCMLPCQEIKGYRGGGHFTQKVTAHVGGFSFFQDFEFQGTVDMHLRWLRISMVLFSWESLMQ